MASEQGLQALMQALDGHPVCERCEIKIENGRIVRVVLVDRRGQSVAFEDVDGAITTLGWAWAG